MSTTQEVAEENFLFSLSSQTQTYVSSNAKELQVNYFIKANG